MSFAGPEPPHSPTQDYASDASNEPCMRHTKYYYEDAPHVFQVENMLYRLYPGLLTSRSRTLNDMLRETKVSSDEQPIRISDLRTQAWDLFIERIHGDRQDDYSARELMDFLVACKILRCPEISNFVIHSITKSQWRFHPAQLMMISKDHCLPQFFDDAFKRLLDTPWTQIKRVHREQMGAGVFTSLVYAKALLDEHRRIVAAEEPTILDHADDCHDPVSCSQDWHAIWWNGMGRFLLDGRNPQPYEDAVERFKELKFGRVNKTCRERMFRLLDTGVAFRPAETFIDDICHQLRKDFFG